MTKVKLETTQDKIDNLKRSIQEVSRKVDKQPYPPQPHIQCESLTLVDDSGKPRLSLFLEKNTQDPAIVMSGKHGRFHIFLGDDGVRVVMADGPGNAKLLIEASSDGGQLSIQHNGKSVTIP